MEIKAAGSIFSQEREDWGRRERGRGAIQAKDPLFMREHCHRVRVIGAHRRRTAPEFGEIAGNVFFIVTRQPMRILILEHVPCKSNTTCFPPTGVPTSPPLASICPILTILDTEAQSRSGVVTCRHP